MGGRVSDWHITENSSFLKNILPGDVVLSDWGFIVADCLGAILASLYIPAYTKGKEQLTVFEVEHRYQEYSQCKDSCRTSDRLCATKI